MIEYVLSKAREIPYVKGEQRIFSAIFDKRNRLVAESPCLYRKSHPRQKDLSVRTGFEEGRCNLHSEVNALIKSRGRGCKIVIARVGANGRPLDAHPCPSCSLAIKEATWIKSVEYSLEQM